MAELTDEEKAKLVAGDVESKADETPPEPEASPEEEPAANEVDGQTEETPEAAAEEAEPETETSGEPATFTKQFPNLIGDTPEDYAKSLEQAYVNSSNEALRLKRELDDLKAQPPAPGTPPAPAEPVPPPTQATDPNVQYAKQLRDRDMVSAFDEFTKAYPQARETEEFTKFSAASAGVAQGYAASHGGMQPTFPELFQGIAAVLGWQAVNPKKDAALKDAASSSQVTSTALAPGRQPKVTDAQVDTYLKMFTSKTRAAAIKELSEVV